MHDATTTHGCLARLTALTSPCLIARLWPVLLLMARLVDRFGKSLVTPQAMARFESRLQRMLRKFGRIIVEWKLNRLESQSRADMPPILHWEGFDYAPKRLSPMRNLHCLFGPIRVQRWLFGSLEGLNLPSLFPLEHFLGIVAGVATPALAQFAARLSVEYTQQQVLHVLREQCHVCWGVQTLRKVTRAGAGGLGPSWSPCRRVAEGIAPFQHATRVELVLKWLKKAVAGRGGCTLAVGRDGLMMPIRGKSMYKEAAAATVSVLDRWGKRLGTIYLGAMPEPGQGTRRPGPHAGRAFPRRWIASSRCCSARSSRDGGARCRGWPTSPTRDCIRVAFTIRC